MNTTADQIPDVTRTSPLHWTYISEGGATIVFSYVGPHDPVFTGTVLRLRKIEIQPPPKEIFKPLDYAEGVDDTSSEEDAGGDTSDDDDEPDDPSIAFQNRITSTLILPKHLPRLEAVKLKRSWLEELKKLGEDKRPASRRTVDTIDVQKKKGVLATDLVGGACWAIEIKPKWAFLPNPYHLSEETKSTKLAHCRFCMHTHQRAIKAPKKYVSKYCPLDLYSGEEERVCKALGALWDAWVGSDGSINNLRIFISGNTIQPSDATGVAGLCRELGLRDTTQQVPDTLAACRPAFIQALLPVLLKTSLLGNLAMLQRTLDSLDIEGLAKLWTLAGQDDQPPATPVGIGSHEVNLKEWEAFIKKYHSEFQSADALSWERLQSEWSNPPLEKLRHYMLAYLLSATFKDCSVILRLPGAQTQGEPTITAIDLDPKSVTRLARWEELDRDIVTSYIDSGDHTKPPCIDAKLGVADKVLSTNPKSAFARNSVSIPSVLVCLALLVAFTASLWGGGH